MPLDVETRITRTSTSRFNNGRESAESTSTTLTVGPRTSAKKVTLLHLEELLEQARKRGAPMDTPVVFGAPSNVEVAPTFIRSSFRPEPLPDAAPDTTETDTSYEVK